MAKMTKEEIQAVGRVIREIAWKNGYEDGKYLADKLQNTMTSHGNIALEDIRIFEKATGYLWKYPQIHDIEECNCSSKLTLFWIALFSILYILIVVKGINTNKP